MAEDLAVAGINRLDEASRVEAWRLEVALQLGYDVPTAEAIASSDGDIHELADLIRSGCPLDIAARII